MTPPPPTTIEPCLFCDATGELLPDWHEHDRKVKHPDDHRKPWERCPLSGMIVELHWWNRRPTPQPTREAALKTGFIITHHGDVRILRDRGPDSYELRECKIEAITFGIHPVAAPKPTEATRDTADSAARQLSWRFKVRRSNDEIAPIEEIAAVVRAYTQRDAPKPPAEWMEAAKGIGALLRGDEMPISDAHEKEIAAIIAKHYTAPAEGWQMVPKEPTEEMSKAGYGTAVYHQYRGWGQKEYEPMDVWKAMLAAAPKPNDKQLEPIT